MANRKEVRVKISSTKKTMKITSAMKLVAAAKVNKMQKKLVAARPYASKINSLFSNLVAALSQEDRENTALLKKRAEIKTVLLVVISSDRGLCGAYNANIVKAANKRIREIKEEGKETKLIVVGRKARSAFARSAYQGISIEKTFTNISSIPTIAEANLIAESAINLYQDGVVDKVEIISTKFISLVASEVLVSDFLPVEVNEDSLTKDHFVILEPNAQKLIETLLPMYSQNRIYQGLLEATTSELAARMTAMSNATSNAKEFIRKLTLVYNKARQASITQELSEIVGGAAALG